MLRDDAMIWWEGAKLSVDLANLSWDEFKRVFFEQYFTADKRSELKREFLTLKQGSMSVPEYIQKFERGCYFVPLIGRDPEEKLSHFVEGLRPTFKLNVRLAGPKTYREAVDKAM
ncbi:hypothetical protein F511_06600 [Dorcoceras hygrometricum]|uniref:Retrotransposon gag domain-containing protein n=1 Tax=Dorcoceras hygrometricum TaxID=472368 RepID=A0A2Z7B5N2_9LAMI|nr:hypothetical protein F511_06600 [Dorcoceras hygrometricum]